MSICTQCGHCCSTLFSDIPIYPDENRKEIPQILLDQSDKWIRLPCVALKNKTCTVYSDRPRRCREYKCKLLNNYEANKITYDEALDKIKLFESMLGIEHDKLTDGSWIPLARNKIANSILIRKFIHKYFDEKD